MLAGRRTRSPSRGQLDGSPIRQKVRKNVMAMTFAQRAASSQKLYRQESDAL
jgi:hypothetical protein